MNRPMSASSMSKWVFFKDATFHFRRSNPIHMHIWRVVASRQGEQSPDGCHAFPLPMMFANPSFSPFPWPTQERNSEENSTGAICSYVCWHYISCPASQSDIIEHEGFEHCPRCVIPYPSQDALLECGIRCGEECLVRLLFSFVSCSSSLLRSTAPIPCSPQLNPG